MKNAGKGPKYISSAYVFPLKKSNEFVGYVTAAARSDWAPILEYSRATPPNALVQSTRNVAQQQGFTVSGNLLYHGGVKYGLELAEGKAMNLRNKQPQTVGNGISPVAMSFDNDHVIDEWRTLTSSEDNTDHSGSTDSISPTDIINPGGSDSDTIYGVPAWTETDKGNASRTYVGTGPDTWGRWDGCSPIAGSMIIGFHEGVSEGDADARESIIDQLHITMDTDNDSEGATDPWKIDDGFDNYIWGTKNYNGSNIYAWNHPDFTLAEISINNRPFLLNMTNGGTAQDRSNPYGNHTTTVIGYREDGEVFELYDTYDSQSHYLTWGSWTACSYTKVTTS